MVTIPAETLSREAWTISEKPQAKEAILTEIKEVAEAVRNERKVDSIKQTLGNLMVGGLIRLQADVETHEQKAESAEKARELLAFFEPFFDETWPRRKSGFLGEVCVALSMKEAGFSFYEINSEDDRVGKIDMLAGDGSENLLAIQAKTSVDFDQIKIHKIDPEKEKLGVSFGHRATAESMIKYVKENETFDGLNVVSLIIELPGGMGNEHAVYNQITGAPIPGTTEEILNQFYSEVWDAE